MRQRTFALTTALLFAYANVSAQSFRPISIPTRVTDAGKQYLAADLYAMDTVTPKPVILIQTPYNKAFYRLGLAVQGSNGAAVPYDSVKYNYVTVDWRGFYQNKDAEITPYNRGLDGYDIVEWIATQPWSNGKIGTWGGSALGSIQFITAAEHPPHLVCAAPFIYDFKTEYSDYYYGGDFRREHVESLQKLGFLTVALILMHQTEDAYIRLVAQVTDIANKIEVPLFMATGWFDHFPGDVIRAFDDVQTKSEVSVRAKHRLLIGPWGHSEMGLAQQGQLTFANAVGVPAVEGMRFFDHYLLGVQNGWDTDAKVRYYQMGDSVWRTAETWNAVGQYTDTLYLQSEGLLKTGRADVLSSPDTLRADPRMIVPTVGGARFNPFDRTIATGPQDLFLMVQRHDVLSYFTEPLQQDLIIDGSIKVKLYFTCDRPDADISVRLCDVMVYPDNRWLVMAQGIQRLRFRNSVQSEQLLIPNTLDSCTIQLQELGLTLKKGHRLAISISGSNYPMFDLNLNNGGAMYVAGDTLIAQTLIHHSSTYPSAVIFESTSRLSGVTRLEGASHEGASAIAIAPNPVFELMELRFDVSRIPIASNSAWHIINALGQVVARGIVSSRNMHIDVAQLPRGMYAIRAAGNSRTFVKE